MGTGAGDDCCITIIPQSPLLWPAGAGRDMAAFGNRLPGGKMPPKPLFGKEFKRCSAAHGHSRALNHLTRSTGSWNWRIRIRRPAVHTIFSPDPQRPAPAGTAFGPRPAGAGTMLCLMMRTQGSTGRVLQDGKIGLFHVAMRTGRKHSRGQDHG